MDKKKDRKKIDKKKRNTSKNNKGFTLMEIIAVVIILGILLVVGGISVTSYIEDSKAKTYESYKSDLKGASENYFVDCMTNNEENCSIPRHGNDVKLTYEELLEKGYTEKLKDPEGDGYCDATVIAKNKSENGVDLEYQVCLYCSKYKSEESGCEVITTDDNVPPTCGDTKGESEEWSKENKVITVSCSDTGSGCTKKEFSSSIGKDGEVIEEGSITIRDKDGNKTTCPVKAYVDRKAPTCKIELDEDATDSWYKTGVTARIVDIDDEGSGVVATGIGTSLVNRNYNGEESYTVTGGIVTVFGYVKDEVGNEGYCSKEVKVDNTKPSAAIYMGYEIYPKENSTINNNILTINNISKYGDIDGVIIYFNEELTTSIESNILDETGKTIKTSGGLTQGNNKGIIKVTSGTYESLQINIGDNTYLEKIEKVEIIKNEDETSVWTNKNVSVYVEGKDTITGVNEYSFDGGNTYTNSNTKSYSENTTGKIRVKDKVGNKSTIYTFTINKIDKISPTCGTINARGTLGNNNWYRSDITLSPIDGSDNLSGHSSTTLDMNSITSDTSGTSVTLTTTDNAGNVCTTSETFKIDKTNPTCGTIIVASGTLGNNDWYRSDVSLSSTNGSDDLSGHSSTSLNTTLITYDTTGTIVTLTTTDNAGNVCTTDKTIKIDRTSPSLISCSAYDADVYGVTYRRVDFSMSEYISATGYYTHSSQGTVGPLESLADAGNNVFFAHFGYAAWPRNVLTFSSLVFTDAAGNTSTYTVRVTYSNNSCTFSRIS